MTIDEFFAELKKVRSKFKWTLVADTRPGSERRAKPRFHLRAVPKAGSPDTRLDPIGAVCYSRTGKANEPGAWLASGHALGLTASVSAQVFAASNDKTWDGPDGQRRPVPELLALRLRLIKAVEADDESVQAAS